MQKSTIRSARPHLRSALIGAIVICSAILLKKGINNAYEQVAGEKPPSQPTAATSWRKALFWSAATGALIGVAKTLVRDQAEKGTDRLIPGS